MTNAASLAFAEAYLPEDEHVAQARSLAQQVGVTPIGNGGGATLSFLAGVLQAKAVVEIGTGTGVSGLYLLRGMAPGGVLTSVDLEAEHQRHARQVFTAAGFRPQQFRLIAGAALDVVTRLTDGGYDLAFLDADKIEYGDYLGEALRLVRTGGLVAIDNVLWHDRVADTDVRDAETQTIRDLLETIRADERLQPVLLPVGDGLLVARVLG